VSPADPKPERRIVNPAACRAKVLLEGVCRLCPQQRYLEGHHIVARSRGGDDIADNIVTLCDRCHEAIERRRPGWRFRLRIALEAPEQAYAVAKCGEAWLDRVYA